MRRRSQLTLGFSIALCAATPPPQTAPTDYAARIASARAEIDRKIAAGPTSPFTPIAVRMVHEGETAKVGVCAGRFTFDPAAGCDERMMLSWSADGFRVAESGKPEHKAEEQLVVGRFHLALSRQEDRGRILVHDPESPDQKAFQHLLWFPPDPAYRYEVRVEPFPEATVVRLGTTAGLVKSFRRYGRVQFQADGKPETLAVFLPEGGDANDPGVFFIPFRDGTSGTESYAVGRYASLAKEADGRWFLDLNESGSPNCAYNPNWNCPIPPAENTLDVPIPVGEKAYPHAGH
jgi:uncharacterized protein (DUF1684 family)